MTIEEAIEHCEEVADYDCYNDKEFECAKDHRQLAEWLKELKKYREELPKEIKNAKILEANVKTENYNSHLAEYIKGYICGLSYTEGIIAKILEEVNADDGDSN
jgi:hypothetical protein